MLLSGPASIVKIEALTGREVLKQLKAEKKTKGIPVIIVSANAIPNQIDKLIKEGAENYLTKPIDVIDFLKVIDEFIVG